MKVQSELSRTLCRRVALLVAATFVVPSAANALPSEEERSPQGQMTEIVVNKIETAIATDVDRLLNDRYSIQLKDITPPAAVVIENMEVAGGKVTRVAPDQLAPMFGHCKETERWSEQRGSDGSGGISAHAALECTDSDHARHNIYIEAVAAPTGLSIAKAKVTRGGPRQEATVPMPYMGPPPRRR